MIKRFLILAILLLTGIPVFAQSVDTAWVRRYNGPGNNSDGAQGIAIDGSGNVYVTGGSRSSETSLDYATMKYYPNGDTAWVRRYNGPEDSLDGASAIAVDGSGNVYVTGGCDGLFTLGGFPFGDYATIKYYPNGDTAWVRRYDGPGNYLDAAIDIAIDGSGNVYVTGASSGSGTSYDYTSIKYLPNGDTAWVRRYNGPRNGWDLALGIAVDGSGNVYVTGVTDDDEGAVASADYATIKYYPDGNTAWVRRYDGPGNDWDNALAIAVDGSGNVYLTGASSGSGTSGDYATIKYDPDGDTAWVRRYNGPGNDFDEANTIAVDNSGNVYVTGGSVGAYATIKYYSNGDTAWVRRYSGPGASDNFATALAVDSCGNTCVTGYSWSGTDFDYATVKYDSSGNELWVETYNGTGNGDDKARAIAVCGCDTVYVTGESHGSGTDKDYVTIKYVPLYSITGMVRDATGSPVEDTLVFLTGDKTAVDTTDADGHYEFSGLPAGDYKVFRDSLVSVYSLHLISDTSGFNFSGYTDIGAPVGPENKPSVFALRHNYPNPFNPETEIEFAIPQPCHVRLDVYNILGNRIVTLVDEELAAGYKKVLWDGTDRFGDAVASGVYFYRIQAGKFSEVKKMMVLK